MNPVANRLKPTETLHFLLVGAVVYYKSGKDSERVWNLNIYSSEKSRKIAERRMKRQSSDIIFIEWDITIEQIVKQGKYTSILPPEKVLLSDKLDIFQQVIRNK